MPINLNEMKTTSKRPDPLPPGAYNARLCQYIELGLQHPFPGSKYDKGPNYYIWLTYELSDEFMLDDEGNEDKERPRHISEELPVHSLSADKAKSTARYNVLDPKTEFEGDFYKTIGAPCSVMLVQNKGKDGRVWEKVAGLNAVRPKDEKKMGPLIRPTRTFFFDEPDKEVFEGLPEFLQDKIKASLEYNGSKLQELLGEEPIVEEEEDLDTTLEDDEIPF